MDLDRRSFASPSPACAKHLGSSRFVWRPFRHQARQREPRIIPASAVVTQAGQSRAGSTTGGPLVPFASPIPRKHQAPPRVLTGPEGHFGGPATGHHKLRSTTFRLQRRGHPTTLPRSVKPDLTLFRERLASLRARIGAAAARAGRGNEPVTLIAVTKTVPADVVAEAVAAGVVDLGENRVQEAESKIALEGLSGVRWHLIGHLQSNKVARAVALFHRVHSVDGATLAESLARRAVAAGRRLPVLIEVNVSREATKFGTSPEDLGALAEKVAALEGLELDGLMTVGPVAEVPEDARPGFTRLRELRDELARRLGRPLPHLSMGMSGDFEVAVEEGSTMVRVGTALFGPRGRAR